MKKLIHPKTLEVNKLELVEFQLKYILHELKSITKTELKILAYLFIYKTNVVDKVVEDQLLTSRKSTENYISGLRKKGIVVGTGQYTKLNPAINIVEENLEFTIKLKLKEEDIDNVDLDKKL